MRHEALKTYELEGHTAGFNAANGDVEEDTGALCVRSVECRAFT